jgi:hypothetical protein
LSHRRNDLVPQGGQFVSAGQGVAGLVGVGPVTDETYSNRRSFTTQAVRRKSLTCSITSDRL